MESEGHIDTVITNILQTNVFLNFHERRLPKTQTLVIWSASGRTVGVTLSSILTCSRTSSGILFNNAGLMVLSCTQIQRTFFKHKNYSTSAQRPQQRGDVNVGPTHLVQLPAEALKDVVFVDLENWFALIEDSVHDHAKGVHVRSRVAADRQNVLGGQVLGVGEAEGRQVGIPLFTRVLRLRSRRGQCNADVTTQLEVNLGKGFPPTHLGVWRVGGRDAEVKAHDLPGAALVEDDVFWTQVSMDHFNAAVEEGQTLRDLKRTQNRAVSIIWKHEKGREWAR